MLTIAAEETICMRYFTKTKNYQLSNFQRQLTENDDGLKFCIFLKAISEHLHYYFKFDVRLYFRRRVVLRRGGVPKQSGDPSNFCHFFTNPLFFIFGGM